MPAVRFSPALLAAVGAAALLAGGTTPIAHAAESTVRTEAVAPRLLNKSMLPAASPFSTWRQTPAAPLESEGFCEEEAFPSNGTLTRVFYNTKSGNAITQYAVATSSTAAAKKVVARVKRCYAKHTLLSDLLGSGHVVPHLWGVLDVADGLTAGYLDHRSSQSPGVLMWAVGRDGKDVTLIQFPLQTTGSVPTQTWLSLSKKALRHVAA